MSQTTMMLSEFLQDNVWIIHLIHLFLAILLFFLVNWIGKNSLSIGYQQLSVVLEEDSAPAFNFLFKVLAPTVYLILCAVIFQEVKLGVLIQKCYFIVIYYWVIRLVWNLFANRWKLLDWGQMLLYWIVSIGISIWIYKNIEHVKNILPTGEALIDEIWLLVIAFLYAVINKMKFGESRTARRKDAYIKSRYEKFKAKYNGIIHPFFNNPFYEVLTYSIMILEDFNRPRTFRLIEYLRFFITQKPHTLGIMQVTSDRYINDRESVRLAIRKIAEDNNEYLLQRRNNSEDEEVPQIYRYEITSYICDQYNGGDPNYADEISIIITRIEEMYYGNQIPSNISIISIP